VTCGVAGAGPAQKSAKAAAKFVNRNRSKQLIKPRDALHGIYRPEDRAARNPATDRGFRCHVRLKLIAMDNVINWKMSCLERPNTCVRLFLASSFCPNHFLKSKHKYSWWMHAINVNDRFRTSALFSPVRMQFSFTQTCSYYGTE